MIVFVLICFLVVFYLVFYLFKYLIEINKWERINSEYKSYIELLKEYNFYLECEKNFFSMRWCDKIKSLKDEIEKKRQRLKELEIEVENIFD